MHQVDATAENLAELEQKLQACWDGQPSLGGGEDQYGNRYLVVATDDDRDLFARGVAAARQLGETMLFPAHVSVRWHARAPGEPDQALLAVTITEAVAYAIDEEES